MIRQSQEYFKQQQDYLGHVNGHVEEMYGGHVVMKAFNGEDKSVAAVRRAQRYAVRLGLEIPVPVRHDDADDEFRRQPGLCGDLSSWAAGWRSNNAITVGDIQAFIQYVRSFTQPITQIANISNILQQTAAAAERVFEFLAEAGRGRLIRPNPVQFREALEGHVEFQHVHFGYNPDKIVINDFSADVKPGQKIAIVGPTGAGKTTMVKLLMRFYDVNSGAILLDGHDIRDFNAQDLRRMFAMVLQDTWLYNGTIMENIRYGRARCQRRRGHRRGQGRPCRSFHPHPAGGLRHGAQRGGHQYLPGPECSS